MEMESEAFSKYADNPQEILNRIVVEKGEDGAGHLRIDGIEDDGERLVMTKEEVKDYIEKRMLKHLLDPEKNEFIRQKVRMQELRELSERQQERYSQLKKLMNLLGQNQVKFFRHVGILPKIPTNSIAIGVDLPPLPTDPLYSAKSEKKPSPEASASKPSVSTMKRNSQTEKPKLEPGSLSNVECIDLTDDDAQPTASGSGQIPPLMIKHPAPLPPRPFCIQNKDLPNPCPKPRLTISAANGSIILQWDMPPNAPPHAGYATIKSFDIFGYQELPNIPINTLLWKQIGTVDYMELPMACTLTQFEEGHRYHFSMRAVDVHGRCGAYSDPISIVYTPHKKPCNGESKK